MVVVAQQCGTAPEHEQARPNICGLVGRLFETGRSSRIVVDMQNLIPPYTWTLVMKLVITKKPMPIAWTMSSRLFCTNPVLPGIDELQVNKFLVFISCHDILHIFVPSSPCEERGYTILFS